MLHNLKLKPLVGSLVASLIIIIWISSLYLSSLIDIDSSQASIFLVLPAILGRAFIQTGLFIVAHDAIHGSVIPGNRKLNNCFGQVALVLYALLPYRRLSLNHWRHHRQPGRPGDPDFHDGVHSNFFDWYLKFMKEYLDFRQRIVLFFGMGIIFQALHLGFHVSTANLALFWVLPIILSSVQLFIFGTYFPHRASDAENPHCATSSNYSPILSFLTCYHFGYHWEHHEYPFLAWYDLPSARRNRDQKTLLESVLDYKGKVFRQLILSVEER